jgi:hypothetical protein
VVLICEAVCLFKKKKKGNWAESGRQKIVVVVRGKEGFVLTDLVSAEKLRGVSSSTYTSRSAPAFQPMTVPSNS